MGIRFIRTTVEDDGKAVKAAPAAEKPKQAAAKPDKPSPTPSPAPVPESVDSVPGTDSPFDAILSGAKGKGKGKAKGGSPKEVEPKTVTPTQSKGKGKGGKSQPGTTVGLSKEFLAKQVYGFHSMVSMALPGAAITEKEANMMGEAMETFAQEFGLVVSSKVAAAMTLLMVGIAVEGQAAMRVRNDLKEKAVQAKLKAQVQSAGKKVDEAKPATIPMNGSNLPASALIRGIAEGGKPEL